MPRHAYYSIPEIVHADWVCTVRSPRDTDGAHNFTVLSAELLANMWALGCQTALSTFPLCPTKFLTTRRSHTSASAMLTVPSKLAESIHLPDGRSPQIYTESCGRAASKKAPTSQVPHTAGPIFMPCHNSRCGRRAHTQALHCALRSCRRPVL